MLFSWFWTWFQFFSCIFVSILIYWLPVLSWKFFTVTACPAETTAVQADPPRRSFPEAHVADCFTVWIVFTMTLDESLSDLVNISVHSLATWQEAGSRRARSGSRLPGREPSRPAGGSTVPFLLRKNVAEMYAEVAQSTLIFFLCKFGLRIFLEGWRCGEATAGTGLRCSLWCWAPGCPPPWLYPGTGYCSHAAGSISRDHTPKVGCLLGGGIWALWLGRWVWRHPSKGHPS